MAQRKEIPDILGPARQPQVDVMGDLLSGNPVAAADNSIIRSQLRYDYSLIPAEQRETVQNAAVDIVRNGKRAQESLILIGERLLEIKEVLEHGQFGDWCETEFSFSQRTAQNMMNVAQTFGGQKRNGVSLLGDATLYLLSAPSTPAAAREEVIEMAQATGTTPTKAEVKAVIDRYKPTMTQLAEMIETRPNLKSADLRAAARKRAGHWLYDTAASNAEATWPGAWSQTTLVNALHYVADALDRADRTPAANVVPSEATHSRQQGAQLATCSVCHRPLSDPDSAANGVGPCCAAKRTTAAGSGTVDDDEEEEQPLQVADVADDDDQNWRIDDMIKRLKSALGCLGDYEEVTGIHSHSAPLRSAIAPMLRVLESNRI